MTLTTFNPADKAAGITLTNSNNTATGGGGNNSVRGTTSHASGKFYFEYNSITQVGGSGVIGLENSTVGLTTNSTNGVGVSPSGSFPGGTFSASPAGHVIGVAVDFNNLKVWFRYDAGNWNNSGTANPATNVGGASISGLSGGSTLFPFVFLQNGGTATINVDGTAFANAAPSGFGTWDTVVGITGTWASTEAPDTMFAVGNTPPSGTFTTTENPDNWSTSSGFAPLGVENFVQTNGSSLSMTTNGPDRILVVIKYGASVTALPNDITSISDTAGLTWRGEVAVNAGEDPNFDNVSMEIWWAYAHNKLTSDTVTITTGSGGTTSGAFIGFAVAGADPFSFPWDSDENSFSLGANFGSFDGTATPVKAIRNYSDGPANVISSGTAPAFDIANTSGVTLTNSNRTVTSTGSGNPANWAFLDPATLSKTTGRWYWEVTFTTINGANYGAGFDFAGNSLSLYSTINGAGGMILKANGDVWMNTLEANIGAVTNGDVIGFAVDLDGGNVFVKNITQSGNWNGSPTADPARGIGGFSLGSLSGISIIDWRREPGTIGGNGGRNVAPMIPVGLPAGSVSAAMTFNFGNTSYAGTKPTGYLSYGTITSVADFDFPAITIAAVASVQSAAFDTLGTFSGFTQGAVNQVAGSQRDLVSQVQYKVRTQSVSPIDNELFSAAGNVHSWVMLYATIRGRITPGAWASTEATDTMFCRGFPGGAGIVGDLTVTEAPDTMAAFGFERDSGVWSSHEAPDIFGASGHQPLSGTLAVTEHADVFVAAGVGRGENGVWASTEAIDIFAASGHTPVSGTFVTDESPDRFVAIGAGVTRARKRRQTIIA